MKLGTKQLGGILGAAVFAIGGLSLLATPGCDDNPITKACNLECPEKGIAEGNFAISGNAAIDGFFKSVVSFKGVASGVSAEIKAELDGIRLAFGVSDADLANVQGDIGAAIDAKLQANFKASIKVDAQPAKCEIDAQVTAQASLDCQANLPECHVEPGMASVSCMGKCTAEVNAMGSCEAEAELKCEVSGPSVACEGECSGSCTVDVDASGKCGGSCKGTCSAAGDANGDGVVAEGECMGTCSGKCELSGMAAASCKGSCNGSCTAKAPMGGCTGGAKAKCEFSGNAMASCTGSCDGDFTPPKAQCEGDASASCEASAKADAKFTAKCTPPSITVKVVAKASIDASAQAQLDYAVGELKLRLPRLLAALKKANLVIDAGDQLTSNGKAAVEATVGAIKDGNIDLALAARITQGCITDNLGAAGDAVISAGTELGGQVAAAGKLTAKLGMSGT